MICPVQAINLRIGEIILWTEGANPDVREFPVKGIWPAGTRGERRIDRGDGSSPPFFTLPLEGRAIVRR